MSSNKFLQRIFQPRPENPIVFLGLLAVLISRWGHTHDKGHAEALHLLLRMVTIVTQKVTVPRKM